MVDSGKVQVVGIIQEQHPERCELFMQWKRLEFPILVDSMNLLDVAVVPITLLIDEYGIVRGSAPRREDPLAVVQRFLSKSFPQPDATGAGQDEAPPDDRQAWSASDWRTHAERLVLGGQDGSLDAAIEAFGRALALDPRDGRSTFRLGVARRMRYDAGGDPMDFHAAVEAWDLARRIDPNQYIWMRRVQQYGPRLMKPYPFYDWVDEARAAIEQTGVTPIQLPVEPRGAELTAPAREFEPAAKAAKAAEPDPAGKIHRDAGGLVRVHGTLVPSRVGPGESARMHLEFRPSPPADAHWNNESGELTVWFDPPEGWAIDRNSISVPNPPEAVSDEPRRIEFELQAPPRPSEDTTLKGYALYYVCEGLKGQCLYRRQDLELSVSVERKPGPPSGD